MSFDILPSSCQAPPRKSVPAPFKLNPKPMCGSVSNPAPGPTKIVLPSGLVRLYAFSITLGFPVVSITTSAPLFPIILKMDTLKNYE